MAQLFDSRPVHSKIVNCMPGARRGADMDHVLLNAETALQVVNVPTPAAALGMDIIIRSSDDDGSLSVLQQVLQPLESGGRVSMNTEWIDTVIKCRIIPATDADKRPRTRREWFAHGLTRQPVYIVN